MSASSRNLRYIIIGAGMAGILAGIRLRERGEENFVIYEKGDGVGGTWRENTYPGVACDTPAHSYSYSFAFNPEWSAFYAPGSEIRGYFEKMTDRFGVRDFIRFNTEIASCRFEDGRWHVTTRDGEEDVADVLVAATGVLHHPSIPDIPGLADFQGKCFHSARWDHDIDYARQRVGVIGNGSTGVQIVAALAGKVQRLVHFQRSPQWIMPCPDTRYSEDDKQAFRTDPQRIEDVRSGPEAQARRGRFLAAIIDANSPELAEIQSIVEQNLENSVRDPALREKLRPNYRAACKRMVFSPNYYEKVQDPTVYVDTSGIERIESDGVRMRDGSFHPLDVLVLATGFKADAFVRPMTITGRDGADLNTLWAQHPKAYYAVTVPDFPNFFMLNGPTGPVGNFSLIDIAERQWNYIEQLVALLRSGRCTEVSPSHAALEHYEALRTEAAKKTVFASGCSSWYLDAEGVPQVWPWPYEHFMEVMEKPNLDDYELTAA
ncbi:NAD(P)/FAD-dependent oxidoreductase [Mangrovimicrobium sediminis]|uniref:NAD(P)/FAD-dependent oxidoreductase n=1 Tax=Mangrovimicrobium sediminis TaxID=2562682 RepID=A0A4Z0LVX4_9GAMM|nr:NAD(P)/FAD-dependent oxidoreductase [Haliea sp. SAOS-164]TGD71288.1 NAD(P)/FAD-dependent oxidoreductase [Haliea sp. SAOS-164]